jgi:hypothetical protein
MCTLLEWTNNTCHDLISRNIWPQPEITNYQELNTMPMHEKMGRKQGHDRNQKCASASTRNTPMSVSTTTTDERSIISYDITQRKHRFKEAKRDAEKLTGFVWIGISHIFLPTFWCPRCDEWVSHSESLHDERTCWQTTKDAQQEGNRTSIK